MDLVMSAKERDRLEVMRRRVRGELAQVTAARLVRLSTRQVRRIERRFGVEGVLFQQNAGQRQRMPVHPHA